MNWQSAFKLGRVSNLPTIWTNVMAGAVLASGDLAGTIISDIRLPLLLLALSLFYIGGMFLNDAFDSEIDAVARPERPIPSGIVTRKAVFAWGFGMLAIGELLLLAVGYLLDDGTGFRPALGGLVLAGLILIYNWHHKENAFGPLVMGLCRVFVYVVAGYAVAKEPEHAVWIGAALLLCYLIGLTYVAKQESFGQVKNLWPLLFLAAPLLYSATLVLSGSAHLFSIILWALLLGWVLFALSLIRRRHKGDIPRAVVSLIAGISILDAVLIASTGQMYLAILAVLGFILTLFLQRYIAGT